jgi:hypothetical protein
VPRQSTALRRRDEFRVGSKAGRGGTSKIWIGSTDGLPYKFVIREIEGTFSYKDVKAPIP